MNKKLYNRHNKIISTLLPFLRRGGLTILLISLTLFTHAQITPTNGIVYVKANGTGNGSSWNEATADIQGAIDATGTKKVFAAIGIYYRTEKSLVMKNNVEIYGGFDPANGIDSLDDARIMPSPYNFSVGSILEASHTRPVIFNDFTAANPLNSSAVLDGFTVAGGYFWTGAGMYNVYASPTLNNLVVRDNEATSDAGAMYFSNSSPTVSNSYIIRNIGWVTSAVIFDNYSLWNANPTFTNVEFSRNTSQIGSPLYGSTIQAEFSDLTLNNCTIAGNTYASAYPSVCILTNTHTGYIRNCIILDGDVQGGKDIKSSLVLDESPINNLNMYIYTYNASGSITDSLLYPWATYTDYGNLFINPAGGVFRLRYGSPAINAGSNSYFPNLNASSKDLDGNPRVTGGTIDAGAHEYNIAASAANIAYVKPAASGLGDGSSWANATNNLQGAIDANGVQKVFVAKGTYQVPSPNSFIMKNGVKIYGGFDPANGIDSLDDARIMPTLGNKGSVLDGKNERPVFWNVFTAANPMDSSTVLDGFTLRNAFGANEGCIHNQYASPVLSNLFITDNDNTGIYNIMSSPTITNTAIVGNPGRGLYQKGGNALLRSVTIGGNSGNALSIIAYDAGNPGSIALNNSVVFGNVAGYNNTNITASYSFIENNAVPGAGNADATGWNTDNVFADTAATDYSLRYNVPAINAGNNNNFPGLNAGSRDIMGNPRLTDDVIDMGAYEFTVNPYNQPIVYVKPASTGNGSGSSWANATAQLQNAIDATGTQQVWVAKGNYNIPSPTTSFVMKNNVALYGGFDPDNGIVNLNNTRIMPDTSGTNGSVLNGMNLKPVVWNFCTAANPMDSTAVMDGFALMNGNSSSDGGAMNNRYASPTLRNLVIKNNTANFGGGIFNRYATPKFSEITLLNNTANIHGGAVYNDASTLTLAHVVAKNNAAYAGGFMYSTNSSVTASDILVQDNTATNIGGIANVNTYANYTDAAIINNTNGGWEQSDTAATLLNCTIVGNTVYGLKALSGTTTLRNSILFGLNGSSYTAQSSFIAGSSDTTNGNFDATGITPAQLFVNAAAGDYHLIALAAVIGKGNNDLYPGLGVLTQGIAKERRLIGGNIDMGAYENSLMPDSNAIVYVKDTATGTGDGSSWANATSRLQDAIDATGTQQVWVAKGIYYVDNRSFSMKTNVRIYGGFDPDNGIDDLSDNRIMPDTAGNNGSILDGRNVLPVIQNTFPGGGTQAYQQLRNAELNGFTIQNGYSSYQGGGISNVSFSYPNLRYLVVRNCNSSYGGGLYNINQSEPTLYQVVFYHDTATYGGGIYNGGNTSLYLNYVSLIANHADNGGGFYQRGKYSNYRAYNFLVKNNSAAVTGGGIFHDTGDGEIINGEITGNTSNYMGSAIYQRTRYITMNNVTVANNVSSNTDLTYKTDINLEWDANILWEYTTGYDYYFQLPECYIYNSILFANEAPYHSYRATNCLVNGNWVWAFVNNYTNSINGENITPEDVFKDPANGDYTLRTSSPAINVGDSTLFPGLDSNSTDMVGNPRVVGRQIDLGAYELQLNITPDANGIAYVKPVATGTKTGDSWANATDNIPEAIKGTGTQQVWVAQGNYPIRGIGFAMKNGVKIYGGFDPDNGISTLNDTRIMPTELLPSSGGAGGGSILDGRNKQPVILNLFKSSTPIDSTARLDGFTITRGKYNYGSGIQNKYASPYLTNLVVKNCVTEYDGGGMYNDSACNPILHNMVISDNHARYGGGIFNRNASPVMKQVLIKDNISDNDGGGMYNDAASAPTLANVAITRNTAVNSGGAIFNRNASPSLINTTVAGNAPDALAMSNGGATSMANAIVYGGITGTYTAQYSLIEGKTGGVNGNLDGTNILIADVFTDTATADYTLKNGSPAIDTGSNRLYWDVVGGGAPLPPPGAAGWGLDLAGKQRLIKEVIDLGAYENNPCVPIAVTDTIVACDSFTWINNVTYTQSNNTATYTITANTTNDCDSIITLNLTIHYGTHNTESQTACDIFTWKDATYTTSGTYTYDYNNTNGCPSTDTLHLTINKGTHNTESQTACESFSWNDTAYTTSGTYTYNYTNATGCPSTDTLHLTINKGTHNIENETACESFLWNGITYTASGIYIYNYTNANGCPSTDTLHLTINKGTHNKENYTTCKSFVWNGVTYTASGTYTYSYTNVNGCPSTDTLHLVINNGTHSTEYQTACEGFIWNGTTYTTSGTYTYTNTNNCRGTDTLHLTINKGTHNTEGQTACGSFLWNNTTYTTSGVYTYDYTNINGCPSTDTLYLTINKGTHNIESQTACESFLWNNTTYTTSGVYAYNYTNANSCPSTDTLHLTVNYGTHNSEMQTASDSFAWNGITYEESGVYTYDYTNIQGCPSTDTLHLTIRGGALPVRLLSFTVQKQGQTALLQWTTTGEQGNKGFDIEHSADAKNWSPIAFLSSLAKDGNNSTLLNYTYTHNTPVQGKNFYRLKQTDYDGRYEYSTIRSLSFDAKNNIGIYPNPANEQVTITGLTGNETIIIYDIPGRKLKQVKSNSTDINISLESLNAGVYQVHIISADGTTVTFKLVKAD